MYRMPLFMMVLLSSVILLSGCWDRKELQDIDLVGAMGIDAGEDDEDNRFLVTVQVINESLIASGAQTTGGTDTSPVTTFSAQGSTISEAFRKISPKLPNELFFPHVQLMLLGQELVEERGIQDLFDWLGRDPQFRTLFPVLIVRDYQAKDALQILTSLEPIPSTSIVGGLKSTHKIWGEFSSVRADKVIQQLSNEAAHIAGLKIIGNPKKGGELKNVQKVSPETQMEIKGLALLKKGKLQTWLDEDKARGVTWVNNELEKTVLNLDCKEVKKGIAIDVLRSKSAITAEIKGGRPVIGIEIRAESEISDVLCPIAINNAETIHELEKQLEQEIKEEVLMALEAAKEEKVDIFRFGEVINRKDHKFWKKIKERWNDEVFPETEVNVSVKGFIRRTGLRLNPYME